MDKDNGDKEFYGKLPKIELHAHINGSISPRTMLKLIDMKKASHPEWQAPVSSTDKEGVACFKNSERGSMIRTFELFALIHEIVQTEEAAFTTTFDVIEEFASENVRYLELRTTPRAVPATGLTKRSYIDAVIRAIQTACKEFDIIVRLLLSIDRRTSIEDAMDTVSMATEYRDRFNEIVVGVDFSGHPMKSDARDFIPVFQEARSKGLKLGLHLAEIEHQEVETLAVLEQVPPDRIGHGTFIHQQDTKLVEIVQRLKIPFELCLTSNLISQSVAVPEDHHFSFWYYNNQPLIICTDDKGVFSTSLSKEFKDLSDSFKLTKDDIWNLSFNAIDHIFAGDDVKEKLRQSFLDLKKDLFGTT